MAACPPRATPPRRPRSRSRPRHGCQLPRCRCFFFRLSPPVPATGDRGAAAVEYTAVAVLACTLAIALLGTTTDHGRRLLAELKRAVCAALDLSGCRPFRDQADDLLPEPCATDTHEVTASIGVSFAASPSGSVQIGERVKSDGTAEVTLTHALHASADAPSPFRWGFDAGPLAEAEVGIAAGVHGGASATHTWTFGSKREADRFRDRIARAEHLHNLSEDSGAFDALGARLVGATADLLGSDDAEASLPPPDRRGVSTSVGAHLSGEAAVKVGPRRSGRPDGVGAADAAPGGDSDRSTDGPPGPRPDGARPPPDSTSADRAPPEGRRGPDRDSVAIGSLDLLHLVSAGAEGNAVVTEVVDDGNGTVSRTVAFEFAETGEVGPLMPKSVVSPEDARDRLTRAALTTTRDRDTGELTQVRMQTVQTAQAVQTVNADDSGERRGRVVGIARLDVTDANRGTVRRWLAGREPVVALTFLGTTARPKDVTSPQAAAPGTVGDFDRLLFREGTYSTVRYTAESNGRDFAADATLGGLTFGGATGWESMKHTAAGARYLAPPGAEGRRELVPFEECAG